ncbi:hypothetical protein MmarC5_0932 [Methanococcus maripaludis C5]|uniref:Uncharacterized protein n=1 Tax=Methanococcus maripaludis (strain C5 / ATCC BAA-1333) TaxID=402880 RepID=A4FYF4_METM5|nr:hypothetical protein [Methanococcus maripaludis]ABO35238.1 hypothetical protein MmarC5_0932 [Methanococcus maripaludis C5]
MARQKKAYPNSFETQQGVNDYVSGQMNYINKTYGEDKGKAVNTAYKKAKKFYAMSKKTKDSEKAGIFAKISKIFYGAGKQMHKNSKN